MRISVAATCLTFCLIGFSTANDAHASIRKETNIPAEGLGPALNALAKDRKFQIVYVTEEIANVRTEGAVGEFTTEEALKRLLVGTGLTYRYLDDKTVTIGSATNPRESGGGASSQTTSSKSSDDTTTNQEGKKSSSGEFRVAQVGQGAPSSTTTTVTNSSNQDNKERLQEIVVTAHYEFLSADTSGTTGLPLPIERVPQSISLVTGDFIKAADLKTIGEIAQYTPGAVNAGSPNNAASDIQLRGFTAGRSVDGINLIQPTALFEPENAIYDRLEIVKGPSSVVYGVSSPGGVVNYVTKSATAQTPDYLLGQVGSWNTFRVEGQAAGALDPAGNVRIIGVVVRDQGDSFIDEVNHQETTVYGGVNFSINEALSGYAHGGYERYVRTDFDGIPTESDGSPAPLPRSFFIGLPEDKLTTSLYQAEAGLTWHATEMLDMSLKGNYEDATVTGNLAYASGLMQNGDVTLWPSTALNEGNKNYGVGASAIYRFDALGLNNSFASVGALYQNQQLPYSSLGGMGTGNVFDGEASLYQGFRAALAGPLFPSVFDVSAHTVTLSAQSVLQVLEPLSVLVGASYSKPSETQSVNYVNNGVPQDYNFSGRMSYRAGLTYEFLPRTFAYVSFSQSFLPQLFLGLGNTLIPPLTGNEYEGGLKFRSADGRLLLTGAVFEIKEKNAAEVATPDTASAITYYVPAGELTNRGLELSALGKIGSAWQINAGYSYLDAKITGGLSFGLTPVSATVGQTQLYIPKQTASVYATYTVQDGALHGLFAGAGARYVGSERTSYDSPEANAQAFLIPSKDIPSYTVLDAALGYSFSKWLVQVNAHNIANRRYYINNYQSLGYGNAPGAPFGAALSIRREF